MLKKTLQALQWDGNTHWDSISWSQPFRNGERSLTLTKTISRGGKDWASGLAIGMLTLSQPCLWGQWDVRSCLDLGPEDWYQTMWISPAAVAENGTFWLAVNHQKTNTVSAVASKERGSCHSCLYHLKKLNKLKTNDFLRPVRELRFQGQLPPQSGESDDFRKSWPDLLMRAEALGAVTGREHLNGNFDKLL